MLSLQDRQLKICASEACQLGRKAPNDTPRTVLYTFTCILWWSVTTGYPLLLCSANYSYRKPRHVSLFGMTENSSFRYKKVMHLHILSQMGESTEQDPQ